MGFDHRWTWNNLSAYMDGELDPSDAARVEKHLKTCSECRQELDSLCQLTSLLRQVPAKKPPRSFLVSETAATERRRLRGRTWVYGTMRAASVLATLLLVFVIGGDLLFFGGQGLLRAPGDAGMAPASKRGAVVETVVVETETDLGEKSVAMEAPAAEQAVEEKPVAAVAGGQQGPSLSALQAEAETKRAPDRAVSGPAPSPERALGAPSPSDDAVRTPSPQPEVQALAQVQPTEPPAAVPAPIAAEHERDLAPVLVRLRRAEIILACAAVVLIVITLLLRRRFRRL